MIFDLSFHCKRRSWLLCVGFWQCPVQRAVDQMEDFAECFRWEGSGRRQRGFPHPLAIGDFDLGDLCLLFAELCASCAGEEVPGRRVGLSHNEP